VAAGGGIGGGGAAAGGDVPPHTLRLGPLTLQPGQVSAWALCCLVLLGLALVPALRGCRRTQEEVVVVVLLLHPLRLGPLTQCSLGQVDLKNPVSRCLCSRQVLRATCVREQECALHGVVVLCSAPPLM
jgi:hypothetical protein